MKSLAIVLFFVGMMPIALVKPHVGILAWALSGLMNPHRLVPGFAQEFPFSMMIGGVTLVSLVMNPKERRPLPWGPPLVVLTIMIAWMNVTTVFSILPDVSWPQWGKVMKIMIMTYVAMMVVHNKARIVALTVVVAFSIGFYGIKGGIFTVLTGGQFMVVGPPKSLIGGNTEISLALTMVFPYLIWVRQMLSNWIMRMIVLGCIVLVAFSIVGSYSRGAFLAGGAMGFFLWWKSEKKLPMMIAMLVLIPVLMSFMPEKYFHKMSTIETYDEDASALGRINAWYFAFHLANHRPLTGGGFNIFVPEMFLKYAPDPYDYHDAHSCYFQMLGHHGYPGLILFLALGFTTWRMAGRIVRLSKGRDDLLWAHRLGRVTEVSIIGYAVGGAFLTLAYLDVFYYQIVIVLATNRLVEEALARSEKEALEAAESATPALPGWRGAAGSPMPAMARQTSAGTTHTGAGGAPSGLGSEVRSVARPLSRRRGRGASDASEVASAVKKPEKLGAFGLIAAALDMGSQKDEAKPDAAAKPLARRRRGAAGRGAQ